MKEVSTPSFNWHYLLHRNTEERGSGKLILYSGHALYLYYVILWISKSWHFVHQLSSILVIPTSYY